MKTMRATGRTQSRALPALLAAAVVSIVLGIIGMHTLNTHGVMSNADLATMTVTADHGTHTSSDATDAHGGIGAATGETSVGSQGGTGHDLGTMVMLCVAILTAAAGAFLLVLLGLRRIPCVWTHLPTAPTAATRWVTARLGAGPPPAWEFSVVRC